VPIALAAAIPVVGLLLLALGLRGRCIDDHPICAKCRFDLIGLTNPGTCPECGTDLSGNVRLGARARRPAFIATGVILLLIAVLGAGVVFAGASLDQYKPTWMLILEARLRQPDKATSAISELIARSDRSELSNADRARLARRAVEVQSDTTQPWAREWAGLLSDPIFLAQLTPAEQEASAIAGANPTIVFRHRSSEGKTVPFEIRLPITDRFLAPGRRARSRILHIIVRDAAGHTVQELDQDPIISLTTFANGWSSIMLDVAIKPGPGEYQIEATCRLQLDAVGSAARGGHVSLDAHAKGPLTIMPAGQPTVSLVQDAAAQSMFADQVTISFDLSPYGDGRQWLAAGIGFNFSGGDPRGPLLTWAKDHKTTFVFKAFVRSADDPGAPETPVGKVALRYNDTGWVLQPGGGPVDAAFAPGAYTLHLVPDIEGAERSMDDEQILGDEVVMPVKVSPAVTPGIATPPPKK
jgi:hypothetical protein